MKLTNTVPLLLTSLLVSGCPTMNRADSPEQVAAAKEQRREELKKRSASRLSDMQGRRESAKRAEKRAASKAKARATANELSTRLKREADVSYELGIILSAAMGPHVTDRDLPLLEKKAKLYFASVDEVNELVKQHQKLRHPMTQKADWSVDRWRSLNDSILAEAEALQRLFEDE